VATARHGRRQAKTELARHFLVFFKALAKRRYLNDRGRTSPATADSSQINPDLIFPLDLVRLEDS
jgi:hypothetical protein